MMRARALRAVSFWKPVFARDRKNLSVPCQHGLAFGFIMVFNVGKARETAAEQVTRTQFADQQQLGNTGF